MEHTVLAGLDYSNYRKTSKSGTDYPPVYGGPVPVIDVYNPNYNNGFVPPTMTDDPKSTTEQVGLYLQDQIRVTPKLLVTAGLRYDYSRNTTETQDDRTDRALTKRFGAMYLLSSGWSPFVSYSESFAPVANQGSQSGFVPTRGKQWEGGVKYEPADGNTTFNVALYDVIEENQLQSNPAVPGTYTQLGEGRVRGVEVDLKTKPVRQLDLIANYLLTDVVDAVTEEVPRHQASLWGQWRFSVEKAKGFSVGAGVRYLAAYADGPAPTVPAVALLDAMVAWENTNWRAALNVGNLTDEVYVASCGRRGDCWFGARRNAIASLTYRW
jgi:iron complex outermembrane recepter protein